MSQRHPSEEQQQAPFPPLTMGKGHIFGELALLRSHRRTATVTAVTRAVCASIDRETLLPLTNSTEEVLGSTLPAAQIEGRWAHSSARRTTASVTINDIILA